MLRRPPCSSATTIPGGLLICISAFLSELVVQGGATPPALYVLGDSQADVGNNNYLVTPARSNFPHNGVDYPGHVPTGRFSNGYNFVDFLAAGLGVASPPPYRSIFFNATGSSTFLQGVNFASGAAGVLALTNTGLCISFDEQIERDYYTVYAALSQQLGEAQASTHLAESVFAVAIGGNDIIDRVLLDPAARGPLTTTLFIDLVAHSLNRQLQRLYGLGMRRLFFVGAAALGCIPLLREREGSVHDSNGCHAEANALSVEYNAAVASILRDLSSSHSDFQYSFYDASTALLQYIRELEANGSGEVKPASSLCPNRSNHVFWDGSPPLVSPVNLRQLISAPHA